KQSEEEVQRLQEKLDRRRKTVKKLKQENRNIEKELNKKLKEGDVRRKNESVYVSLESQILFGVGNVHVTQDIQSELKKIAQTLKDYSDREIHVEGHTDDLPLQGELKEKYGSNWELSAQRAINVLKYLVYSQGVSRERIGAVAYGQFRPRVPNTSDENRRKNRRVEIVLLPSEVPEETRNLVP
ncbi:MAG: flagellar motor protein MotB, partial [bacterium]